MPQIRFLQRFLSELFSIFLILVNLLICSGSGSAQELDSEASKYFERAINAPNLTQRIKYLEKAIQIEPIFKDAVFELGKARYQKGAYESAIDRLSQSVRLDSSLFRAARPYLLNAYTFLARELNENEHLNLAHGKVLQALEIAPDYAPALTILAEIHFNLGEVEHAFEVLGRSIAINPDQEKAWSKLGDFYLSSEDYDKAVNSYKQALEIDPEFEEAKVKLEIAAQKNQPEFWLARANNALKDDDLNSALDLLQRARLLYPEEHSITSKLDSLTWEQDYSTGLAALQDREWPAALSLFQKIHPEYKKTSLKLEEARAELLLSKPDSLVLEESREKKAKDSLTNSKNVNTAQADPIVEKGNKIDSDLGQKQSSKDNEFLKIEEGSQAPPEAGASNNSQMDQQDESIPTLDSEHKATPTNLRKFLIPSNVIKAPKIVTLPEVLGMIIGIFVLGWLFVKLKNATRIPARVELISQLTKTENGFIRTFVKKTRLSTQTLKLFKEKLTSDTPVFFGAGDSSTTWKGGTESGQDRGIDGRDPNLVSAQETKTILGGIKKVRRIGRYVIEKEIARGSMGQVFKAWDPKLDRTVVIKQVAFNFGVESPDYGALKKRLYREAQAAGKLNHPNIVVIYDVDEDSGFCFIVMEYVEGENLRARMERQKRLELESVLRIASQVCSALDYAHNHDIIHRDIKPSNILLTNEERVKVADFGIAKLPKLGTLTFTGDVLGTPLYMSPEQIEGRHVDGRSDVFSLGVVLYEMLTGARPFDGDSVPTLVYKIVHQTPKPPSSVNESVSPAVDKIISGALEKDPEKRFASAARLLEALQNLRGEVAEK